MLQRNKTLFKTNLTLLITFISFSLLAPLAKPVFGIFTPMILFLLIFFFLPFYFVKKKKLNFKEIFSLNKISIKELLIVIFTSFFVLLLAQLISALILQIYKLVNIKHQSQLILKAKTHLIVYQFFITAIFVPIMEEAYFRGFLFGIYRKYKVKHFIILTGILFGLFHIQIHVVIGTAIAGIFWGYFVKYTGSIISSIISHILFNATTLAMFYIKTLNTDPAKINKAIPKFKSQEILSIIFVALTCVTIIYLMIKLLKKNYEKKNIVSAESEEKQEAEKVEIEDMNKMEASFPIYLFIGLIILTSVFFMIKNSG